MPDAPTNMIIATARAADRVAALELLFRHFPPAEALSRSAVALPLLHEADCHHLNLLVARDTRGIVGAMLVQALPGGTGIVWPPQVFPPRQPAKTLCCTPRLPG